MSRRPRTFVVPVLAAFFTAGAAHPAAGEPPVCLSVPTVDERCVSWVATYDNPGGHGALWGMDRTFDVAASRDLVFTTGWSWDDTDGRLDILTVALRPDTGAQVWTARYNGPVTGPDASAVPMAMEVSPDGARLFVTGMRQIGFDSTGDIDLDGGKADVVTLAYDARDGRLLWAAPYGAEGSDIALGLAVAPDGSRTYVTGWSDPDGSDFDPADAVTLAYDAATGEEAWRMSYDGGGKGTRVVDYGSAVEVSPDGSRVFVAGTRNRGASYSEFVTLAYDTDDGRERWASVYLEPIAWNEGIDLAVSPDGASVFTTGRSQDAGISAAGEGWDYATVAYAAGDGSRRWVARYEGVAYSSTPTEVAADDNRVYVTGSSLDEETHQFALVTAAYNAATGASAWTARMPLPAAHGLGFSDYSVGLAVAGGRVYAAGFGLPCVDLPDPNPDACGGLDYLANAYDDETGDRLWTARYNSGTTGLDRDRASGMALSQDGRRLFITGTFIHEDDDPGPGTNRYTYGTVAYET